MRTSRPAAVAGLFYPDDPRALAAQVDACLPARVPASAQAVPKVLIVPHAGYVYSGPVAGSAYALLAPARGTIRRVVLMGPTHRVAVRGLALPDADAFVTPLGEVQIDRAAADAALEPPQVQVNGMAHAMEHSLEVQLPFLQVVLDDFTLLPFAVGYASAEAVAEVIDILWGGPETLILVSSDLSHYHPYREAQARDAATAAAIVALQPELDHDQACGATPINGLLTVARRRGLQARSLAVRNSGDTAGDRSRVVGYGAFAFGEEPRHD